MKKRTPDEENAAFKARCEALFAKEARCGACQKARRNLTPDMPQAPCEAHQRIRREMAIAGMRL